MVVSALAMSLCGSTRQSALKVKVERFGHRSMVVRMSSKGLVVFEEFVVRNVLDAGSQVDGEVA